MVIFLSTFSIHLNLEAQPPSMLNLCSDVYYSTWRLSLQVCYFDLATELPRGAGVRLFREKSHPLVDLTLILCGDTIESRKTE